MATSAKHSGFKRLIDRNPTLAILVGGAEALTFREDSAGGYVGLQGGVPTYSAAGCADGSGVSLATGYSASGSNRFSAFEIVADTGSTDLAGDTYEAAIHGKLNIGTAQTNASLLSGLFSLDIADESDLSGGNYFALRGHLDFWDDCDSSGTTWMGALSAYVENESTTTVGAGTYLVGLDVYQVGAPTNSGTNPAINIRANSSSAIWQYGIHAVKDSVSKFIQLGALSSSSQTGHHLTSSNPVAVDFCMDDNNTTLGNEVYIGTRNRIMLFKDAAGVSIFGTRGQIKCANGVDFATGVFAPNQGYIELVGDTTASSGAKVWGYDSCIEIPTSKTLTVASGGYVAGLHAELTGAGSVSSSGVLAGLCIDSSATTAVWQYGIYMGNQCVNKVLYAGSSSYPVTDDTASTKFVQIYADCGATSGVAVLNYGRLYVTGAAGGGCAVRAYCDIAVVGASGGSGVQATCGVGESTTAYSVTGLGTGVYANVIFANNKPAGGTYAAINCELYSCGSNTDISATRSSFIRFSDGGTADKISDYAYLFDFTGFTSGSAHVWYDKGSAITPGDLGEALRVITPGGVRYIALYDSIS